MIKIEDAHDLAKVESGPLDKPTTKPLSIGQLERALLERYPEVDAEPWDRMGLLAGNPAMGVTGVVVALDPTPAAVKATVEAGANVLLTHHPVFLDPPTTFTADIVRSGKAGACVYEAVEKGVALMNFHTALDANPDTTRLFPHLMSFDFKRLLVPFEADAAKGYGMLCSVRATDKPFTLAHLAARATSVFGRAPRVWGDFDATVETVAIANGSAGSIIAASLEVGVDCLLCGEVRYHDAIDAAQAGMAIAELGHDVSELPLCALLAQAAIDAGVPKPDVTILDQFGNWRYPDAVRA